MAKYNKVTYLYSGYASEDEAKEAKDRLEEWFIQSHPDHLDWTVNLSVYPSQYGYKVQLDAERGPNV